MKPVDWVELFRRIGAGARGAVIPIAGTEAGGVRFEVGAGGDTTMEVDRADLEPHTAGLGPSDRNHGAANAGADAPKQLDPVDGFHQCALRAPGFINAPCARPAGFKSVRPARAL